VIEPRLLQEIVRVAGELSGEAIQYLASTLEKAAGVNDAGSRITGLGSRRQRELGQAILSHWSEDSRTTGPELAAALVAAQIAGQIERDREQVELIWTGPQPPGSHLRRTDQALFEVVDRARERLLLVTYAAYNVPILVSRLQEAEAQGVEIRLVLESEKGKGGTVSSDPLRVFRSALPGAEVLRWPSDEREWRGEKIASSLHAKCAVADDQLAFVSSANFTGDALSSNIELGVLIEGEEVARRIADHFEGLLSAGVLVTVD